jgi:hypothetical protein
MERRMDSGYHLEANLTRPLKYQCMRSKGKEESRVGPGFDLICRWVGFLLFTRQGRLGYELM